MRGEDVKCAGSQHKGCGLMRHTPNRTACSTLCTYMYIYEIVCPYIVHTVHV